MKCLTHKNLLKGKRAKRKLRRYAWAVNQVWNYCVQIQLMVKRAWQGGLHPKWLSEYDFHKLTAGTSKSLGLHAQTVQSVCEQFVKSRDLHRKCPKFRRSGGSRRSLGWVPFKQRSRQVSFAAVTYLGDVYRFFGAKKRPLPETAKGGCFVEDARGRWWVCFQVEVEDLPQAPDVAIGIDLGLKTQAVLSTGTKYDAPRVYRAWEDRLRIAQRAKDSDRVKAINAKIKNCRQDDMHKWTTEVTKKFRTIFVGDVSSSQLAKTKMAKSVYDVSWFASKQALFYKASRRRGMCKEVTERFSTQICSTCGALPPERPKGIADLGMREWRCSRCGTLHDRDVNAARNILAFGLSAQPLVEESRAAYGR